MLRNAARSQRMKKTAVMRKSRNQIPPIAACRVSFASISASLTTSPRSIRPSRESSAAEEMTAITSSATIRHSPMTTARSRPRNDS